MLHGSNKKEKNNNANQYEFPDLRLRDRQSGPHDERGRGAKAKQPDRPHRTGHRQIRPSTTPEGQHTTERIPDSQPNPRDQRHTHHHYTHRLRRYSADPKAREPDGPWSFTVEHTAYVNREHH